MATAADQGVASALESVLSENTRRVYGAQWRLFNEWCDNVEQPCVRCILRIFLFEIMRSI